MSAEDAVVPAEEEAPAQVSETIELADGTTMELARSPDMDDAAWEETKENLINNPDYAHSIENFQKDHKSQRDQMLSEVIMEYYMDRLQGGDSRMEKEIHDLEQDPEFQAQFNDVRRGGGDAARKYSSDENMMNRVSKKMGGLPAELQPIIDSINERSITIHEACQKGHFQVVENTIKAEPKMISEKDHKGVFPLAHAIACNRVRIVKALLDANADAQTVDKAGNSGLHYAAGYGRSEIVKYLLKTGVDPEAVNGAGDTPLLVAAKNKQSACIEVLQQHASQGAMAE